MTGGVDCEVLSTPSVLFPANAHCFIGEWTPSTIWGNETSFLFLIADRPVKYEALWELRFLMHSDIIPLRERFAVEEKW